MAGLVPDPVLRRRDKSRFDEILLGGLAGTDLAAIRRLLAPGAEVYAFADRGAVGSELLDGPPARHPRGRLYWAAGVWRLATAECWLRFQSDPASPERLLDELGNGALPLSDPVTA